MTEDNKRFVLACSMSVFDCGQDSAIDDSNGLALIDTQLFRNNLLLPLADTPTTFASGVCNWLRFCWNEKKNSNIISMRKKISEFIFGCLPQTFNFRIFLAGWLGNWQFGTQHIEGSIHIAHTGTLTIASRFLIVCNYDE